jgi:hypothetical protein
MTAGAIVTPSALADLRLRTSSNRVGCSTAMSAGLAPSDSVDDGGDALRA